MVTLEARVKSYRNDCGTDGLGILGLDARFRSWPVCSHIPIIDVSPLIAGDADLRGVATEIGRACRETGFF